MRKSLFYALLLMSSQIVIAQTPAFITDSLDSYIRQGMKDWNVPGLAIVIVKGGKVVFMKGYGVQDTATQRPVDENTLFMIASNTKLFTATALSQLEYDKKISLDSPFLNYFPDFRLYDPISTKLLTIRDLLCHRIGTKTYEGDFTFLNSRLTSEQIMTKMRLLRPQGQFRSHYGYCNDCFMAAGQVIPKVIGKPWKDYIKDSILTPLGMSHTYTSIADLPDTRLLVTGYTTYSTGALRKVPWDNWDNLAPAAALLSSVSDLSHWLLFQLDSGRYEGRQVMPFDILQRTRSINNLLSSERSARLPTHIIGYGLGLEVADYNGRQVFWHGGGATGIVSVVGFVPEERLGIAVLSNNDYQSLCAVIRYQVLDAYTGMPYINRSRQFLEKFNTTMADTLKNIRTWQARVKGSSPSLPLSAYLGHYTNEIYGSLDVTTSGELGQLLIKFNSHDHLTARLSYMDSDDWLLQYDNMDYGIFSVRFTLNRGKVLSLETKESDYFEMDPYVFVKQ